MQFLNIVSVALNEYTTGHIIAVPNLVAGYYFLNTKRACRGARHCERSEAIPICFFE